MPWENVQTSGNQQYRLFRQEKTSSCGVACAMMVIKLKQNKELDEVTIRNAFTKAEGSINKDHTGHRNFDDLGCSHQPIIGVLAEHKISANLAAYDKVAKWIKTATPSKPVILNIKWGVSGQNGGHWVVCVGHSQNLICLDPWYGLVESQTSLFPFYFATASDRAKIAWLIQTG
jgi:hypothetical protein